MSRATARRRLVKWSAAGLAALLVWLVASVPAELSERNRALEDSRRTVRALGDDLARLRSDLDAARHRSEEQTRLLLLLADEVRRRGGDPEVIVVQGTRGPQGPAGAPGGAPGGGDGSLRPQDRPPGNTSTSTSTTTTSPTTTTTQPPGTVTTVCTTVAGGGRLRARCLDPQRRRLPQLLETAGDDGERCPGDRHHRCGQTTDRVVGRLLAAYRVLWSTTERGRPVWSEVGNATPLLGVGGSVLAASVGPPVPPGARSALVARPGPPCNP